MSEQKQSDSLKNLMEFIICLAIIGTIIALAYYFVVALPAQNVAAVLIPGNGG